MDISWMDRWMECMHAEHLERSAHASWTVFPDILAAVSVSRVDADDDDDGGVCELHERWIQTRAEHWMDHMTSQSGFRDVVGGCAHRKAAFETALLPVTLVQHHTLDHQPTLQLPHCCRARWTSIQQMSPWPRQINQAHCQQASILRRSHHSPLCCSLGGAHLQCDRR